MEKTFKLWNHKTSKWVIDNFEDYLHLNWYLPNNKQEGECFVDITQDINVEIVYPDENGEFLIP